MNRKPLINGGWFDIDAATCWNEDKYWNGNNHISCATGSQWDHEKLYRTAQGTYVKYFWSQYQGRADYYEAVTPEFAAQWLVKNDEKIPDDLAETAQKLEK